MVVHSLVWQLLIPEIFQIKPPNFNFHTIKQPTMASIPDEHRVEQTNYYEGGPVDSVQNLQEQEATALRHHLQDQKYSSSQIMDAIFSDMHSAGRPSDSLSPVMSSYASMRLGMHSDTTSTTSLKPTENDETQSLDGGFYLRGQQRTTSAEDQNDEYQRVSGNNTWITALTWDAQQAGMLPLALGSKSYIEEPAHTVEYLTALAHEWSTIPAHKKDSEVVSYYVRAGADAIFRVSMHKAHSFISRPTKQENGNLKDNLLHVAALWDAVKSSWLLLGVFLCSEDLVVDDSWSGNPKEADEKYTQKITQKSSNVTSQKLKSAVAEEGNPMYGSEDDEEDDDYWAQYDDVAGSDGEEEDEEGSKVREQTSEKQVSVETETDQDDEDEDDYYKGYDEVEPMIHGDDVDRSKNTEETDLVIPSRAEVTAPTELTAFVQQSRSFSKSAVETSPINISSSAGAILPENSALKTHVTESMASLYKFASSQGISLDQFVAWTLEATQKA